ncbi:rhodanese-like domain-containing protein [Magnetococcales bacterium HHB-1]
MRIKHCLINGFSTLSLSLISLILSIPDISYSSGLDVRITKEVEKLVVRHGNQMVTIKRNQNLNATIQPPFSRVSRKCPPFCIQPMQAAPGVQTVGELEVINFMRSKMQDGSGLIVDARTPDWYARGTIPGSINIPYTDLNASLGAEDFAVESAFTLFGAKETEDQGWNFSEAKTLILWCNGPWCGQSPTAIRGLIKLGYPKEKLLYYRGGMQLWQIHGLTTIKPIASFNKTY